MLEARHVWEAEVASAKTANKPKTEVDNIIQQRGRDLRKFRLAAALLDLILAAEKESTMTYDEFSDNLRLGSHWERNIILRHLLHICHEAGFPLYPVLVHAKGSLIPSEGFFDDCRKMGVHISISDAAFAGIEIQKCYHSKFPDEEDVLYALAKHYRISGLND